MLVSVEQIPVVAAEEWLFSQLIMTPLRTKEYTLKQRVWLPHKYI